MPILFADNFLAGAILSLVLPLAVLIALSIWYTISLYRVPGRDTSQVDPLPRRSEPLSGDPAGGAGTSG